MTMHQFPIGKNTVFDYQSDMNKNIVIVGSSGSGKTKSIVEPFLLNVDDRSLIIPVSKERIVTIYEPYLTSRGYTTSIINLTFKEKSTVCFDPMRMVENEEDAEALASAVIMAEPRKESTVADPFWDHASIMLLTALILYVKKTEGNAASISYVCALLKDMRIEEDCDSCFYTSLDGMFNDFQKKYPDSYALQCWNGFKVSSIKTARSIVVSTVPYVLQVFKPQLLKMMNRLPAVRFEDLADHKSVLFIVTSPADKSDSAYASILFSYMFHHLIQYAEKQLDGALPIPVTMIFDDFACGARVDKFYEYISMIREKEISVILLLQSESQLELMYGNAADVILNNCDTYIYLGGRNARTISSMSRALNLPYSTIQNMPVGRVYIVQRGRNPIADVRYSIYDDPVYQKIEKAYNKKVFDDILSKYFEQVTL